MQLIWNQPPDDTPFEPDAYRKQGHLLSVHIETTPVKIRTISTLAIRKTPICKASLQCPTKEVSTGHYYIWSVQPTLSLKIVIFIKGNLGIISL